MTRQRRWLTALLLVSAGLAGQVPVAHAQSTDDTPLLAFPGAVGFGAHARGGRGGEVVAVSTLADDGPGSLREALGSRRWQQGQVIPRSVVFRIAGTITLNSPLWIREPYLSLAGQSAPGGGIALRTSGDFDGPALAIDSHDIVVRHLRIRPAQAPEDACCGDALAILGGQDIIIDHCSLSWGTDEVLDLWFQPRRVTIQHSIIAQGRREMRGKISGKGVLIGDHSDQVTLYGNLMAHQLQRSPLIMTHASGLFQVVNNVIYNWRHFGSEFLGDPGPVRVNLIGNTYRAGPETRLERYEILATAGAMVYLQDNLGPRRPLASLPAWPMVGHHRPHYNRPAPTQLQANTAFPGPPLPVLPAEVAYQRVLSDVGATRPQQDSADRQLLQEVRLQRNSLAPPPDKVEDWPRLAIGSPYPDADRDGMDDRWERDRQLNPDNPDDRNDDPDGNGYTHLDEFLQDLATDAGIDATL